ncbi:hypothetical protein [Nocardioides ultimimeridianus]
MLDDWGRLTDRGRAIYASTATALVVADLAILLTVHLSRSSDLPTARLIGQVLPGGIVPPVAVFFVASRMTGQRWPVWTLAGASVGITALWYCFASVLPGLVDGARAEVSGQADYRIVLPAQVGPWARAKIPPAKERQLRMSAGRLDLERDGLHPQIGVYTVHGRSTVVLFGVNLAGGSLAEARHSTSEAAREMMRGAEVDQPSSVDAGHLGGSMSCGIAPPAIARGYRVCVWSDASTMGMVFVPAGSDDRARAVALQFREGATKTS